MLVPMTSMFGGDFAIAAPLHAIAADAKSVVRILAMVSSQ
jgi:hypothetical protein